MDVKDQTFEVKNWKSDPKIWPHDKMYGVYSPVHGEQQVFNFLELAFSDTPITKLEDGLTGRYFIGLNCVSAGVCDFAKASPIPHWMGRGYTPASEQQSFLL